MVRKILIFLKQHTVNLILSLIKVQIMVSSILKTVHYQKLKKTLYTAITIVKKSTYQFYNFHIETDKCFYLLYAKCNKRTVSLAIITSSSVGITQTSIAESSVEIFAVLPLVVEFN